MRDLIERLGNEADRYWDDEPVKALFNEAAARIHELEAAAKAAPPLPKEIAGLIERLDDCNKFAAKGAGGSALTNLIDEAATALRALAQENEKLKAAISAQTDKGKTETGK
jgi:hypothetical protein